MGNIIVTSHASLCSGHRFLLFRYQKAFQIHTSTPNLTPIPPSHRLNCQIQITSVPDPHHDTSHPPFPTPPPQIFILFSTVCMRGGTSGKYGKYVLYTSHLPDSCLPIFIITLGPTQWVSKWHQPLSKWVSATLPVLVRMGPLRSCRSLLVHFRLSIALNNCIPAAHANARGWEDRYPHNPMRCLLSMIQRFRVTAGWLGVTGLGLNIGNPRLTTVEGRIEITGVPFVLRLFYGCSSMFHLSGNNRRDSHFMGS